MPKNEFRSMVLSPRAGLISVYKLTIVGFIVAMSIVFAPKVFAATPTATSAKITGQHTAVITYSEAVNTQATDYSNFSGAFSGKNLSAISGTGSNTITLTFDGSSFATDATGAINIAPTTVSVSDSAPFSSGTLQFTDGQAPSLASVTVSSNNYAGSFAKTGNTINLSFGANESVSNVTTNILGHVVYAGGNGSGPYNVSYTISSSDTQDSIPVVISFKDTAGNTGNASLTISNSSTVASGQTTSTNNAPATIPQADFPPSIFEEVKVPAVSTTNTPNYTFFSSTAGVIKYYGDCVSPVTSAKFGDNTVTFNALANRVYSNCIITVTNSAGESNQLQISIFRVDTTKAVVPDVVPALSEVTPLPKISSSATPSYTFSSAATGTISYAGACGSATTGAVPGNNTVIFNTLANATYSDCVITVTNSAGFGSLHLAPFTINTSYASVPTTPTVAGTSTFKFTLALKSGSKGNEVLELQKRLVDEGYLHATPNGNYGPATIAAVKAFQKAHGLSQLGTVGPGTRAALNGE